MYWLSSWDNLHAFSRQFNEDIFIRFFFDAMFLRKISTNFIFFRLKEHSVRYEEFLDKYKLYLRHSVNFKQVPRFLKRFYKIPYYWSKIRILRFQKWLVVYLTIFNTNKYLGEFKVDRRSLVNNLFKFNKIVLKKSFTSDLFDF